MARDPHNAPGPDDGLTGVARDIGLVAALAGIAAAVAIIVDPVSMLSDGGAGSDNPVLNGLLGGLVVGGAAALIVAYRRFQESERLRTELTRLAHHDPITGLPNRNLLTPWLGQILTTSRREQSRAALILIDLDRFARINDTHGIDVGDALLNSVALRLRAAIDDDDRVLRTGGSQFAVISPRATDATALRALADHIVAAVTTPHEIEGKKLQVPVTIGMAITDERAAATDDLIRDADAASHKARAEGPGAVKLYEQSMHSYLTPANAERRLREALDRGEFELVYQPILFLDRQELAGAEALLRWKHPDRGLVGPGDFLPAMEDTGLIVPVGNWVIHEACRQAHHWNQLRRGRSPIEVTVNVSARQLIQADFVDVLTSATSSAGVQPSSLCLEISEDALKADLDAAWAVLRHAKALGTHLALDDFGTGASSVSALRSFTLDRIKIDPSFVAGVGMAPEDTAIVRHLVALARELSIVTVAEGVESQQQLSVLQELGCERAQGWFFSHPVGPGDIDTMVQQPFHPDGHHSTLGLEADRAPAPTDPPPQSSQTPDDPSVDLEPAAALPQRDPDEHYGPPPDDPDAAHPVIVPGPPPRSGAPRRRAELLS